MFEDIIGEKEDDRYCILKTGELWTKCPNFKRSTSMGEMQCQFADIKIEDQTPEFICKIKVFNRKVQF